MIAVDTSALLAVLLNEAECDRCRLALASQSRLLLSAGTFAEALIVAGRRGVARDLELLVAGLPFEIVPVTAAVARSAAAAYDRWGKGVHPAGLNLGDCFAYAIAREHDCPLLYIGGDFSQTDIKTA